MWQVGFAQNELRPVKISKEIGRLIDSGECRKFNLYFCNPDFISAQVLSVSRSTMILRIKTATTVTDEEFTTKDLTKIKIAVGAKGYTATKQDNNSGWNDLY